MKTTTILLASQRKYQHLNYSVAVLDNRIINFSKCSTIQLKNRKLCQQDLKHHIQAVDPLSSCVLTQHEGHCEDIPEKLSLEAKRTLGFTACFSQGYMSNVAVSSCFKLNKE